MKQVRSAVILTAAIIVISIRQFDDVIGVPSWLSSLEWQMTTFYALWRIITKQDNQDYNYFKVMAWEYFDDNNM